VSAWLLSSGGHHHGHIHGGEHDDHGHDERHEIATPAGTLVLEVFEDGVPPRFRLRAADGHAPAAEMTRIHDRAARRRKPGIHTGRGAVIFWSPSRKFQSLTHSLRISTSAAVPTLPAFEEHALRTAANRA